jgi:hypothetical protein
LNDPGIDGVSSCVINISRPLDKEKIKPFTYMKETRISFEMGMSVTRRSVVRCQFPVGSSSPLGIGLIFDEDLSPDECTEILNTLELKKCGRYWELLNLSNLVYRDFNRYFNKFRK